MLKQYIATGFYVDDCGNGLQIPITGFGIYTGYTNYYDSYNKAYCLAINNAVYLRNLNPCLSPSTTATSTTTTSTTTLSPAISLNPIYTLYNWTGDFTGDAAAYYDIVSWGNTNGYLSGNRYNTNQYFSSLSTADYGNQGVVLAVLKGSGVVTGFGDNSRGQLDIPTGLTGAIQVSVGYDHCVALLNNGRVTGWGRDNWGALNINQFISNATKVQAGIGSTIVLFSSGRLTGTDYMGGGNVVPYIAETGFKDISHSYNHILLINVSGMITGIGTNSFGETNLRNITSIPKIFAGNSTSMITFSGGYVSGYGTNQARYNTPSVFQSGVDIQLKNRIGTILLENQDIIQWDDPWEESSNLNKPNYLRNNIVAISQSDNFTAAIFRRLIYNNVIITGNQYAWQITDISGQSFYGGLSTGDRYSGNAYVIQPCDSYTFVLPSISTTGTIYIANNVTNCSSGAGTHTITFQSVYTTPPIININYTNIYANTMTGFAATGITTEDYWNQISYTDTTGKVLIYSHGEVSSVSGGHIYAGTGSGVMFNGINNMYSSYISGVSGYSMRIFFTSLPIGSYKLLTYAHGSGQGQYSSVTVSVNNALINTQRTTSGASYNNLPWLSGTQYVLNNFNITNPNHYLYVQISGFINGIQIVPV